MRRQAKADLGHSRGFVQRAPSPCPYLWPCCFTGPVASQTWGKLQGLIPGSVPRVNNAGTSQSQGSPETTTHHKGQEEAEVLARAEGGCDVAGGVRIRAYGKVPGRAT